MDGGWGGHYSSIATNNKVAGPKCTEAIHAFVFIVVSLGVTMETEYF